MMLTKKTQVLENKNYCINTTSPANKEPMAFDLPYFAIVSCSLVRNMQLPFTAFTDQLEAEIASWPNSTLLGILPEYCWRLTPPSDVFNYIDKLKTIIPKQLTLVLGTLEFTLNGKYTSNAIILADGELHFRPKSKILDGEVRQGMDYGYNAGVINLPFFKLGVLVCADLWENQLVHELVVEQKADILAVPAWTATVNRNVARKDWHALTRTQSTAYSVIVAVSDHLVGTKANVDVANATQIRSPDKRAENEPEGNIEKFISFIDAKKVADAGNRWQQKGLAPCAFFKEQQQAAQQHTLLSQNSSRPLL